MKKWFRWKGLIALLCLVVLFSIIWFFILDGIVKRMIENYGTEIVGAKVELDDVDVGLLPLGIILSRIQVTNPDEPMTNAIEIRHTDFSLDGLNLLRRKVIIDNMKIDGIRFNTQRKTSGAIGGKKGESSTSTSKGPGKKLSLPSFQIPNVREILEKEDLQSVKLIKSLQADIQAEKSKWEETLRSLPDKKKLNGYKKRIEDIKSSKKKGVGGILGASGEILTIKKKIEQDINALKKAGKGFEGKLASLKGRLEEVKKAPQEDIRRLKEKYALSPKGLANMSQLLLGPKVGKWLQQSAMWYEKLKPILEGTNEGKGEGPQKVKPIRGKGVNVSFKDHETLPDFLIRKAKVSFLLDMGSFSGEIKNITPEQDVLRIPLTFAFSGDKLKSAQSAKLDGKLDHIVPAKTSDTANLTVKGYQAQDIPLSEQKEFPVTLKKGVVDFDLNGDMKGDALTAVINAGLQSVKLSTGLEKSENKLAVAMGSALSDISKFSINAEVKGTLKQYETKISSDLDQALKGSVGKMVQENAAEFEKKLKAAVLSKVGGPMKGLNGNFNQLKPIENELTSRMDAGKGLLGGLGEKQAPGGIKLPFSFR